VLAQANISLDQLDVVELVGGGVRMPRVQVRAPIRLNTTGLRGHSLSLQHIVFCFCHSATVCLQAELKAFLASAASDKPAAAAAAAARTEIQLGQHLNGDESMALGAAFVAANRSSSFRVRQVSRKRASLCRLFVTWNRASAFTLCRLE
jgi:hypothetical protein